MTAALAIEIERRKEYAANEPIDTIYFGGGTPSLLPVADTALLMNTIARNFSIRAGAEVTLEANPDDISDEALNDWSAIGINRLSIGIQSFADRDLRSMNRAHNAADAKRSIEQSLRRIPNISIDLIYGNPATGPEQFTSNLRQFLEYRLPHLSAYALTVEPGTALDIMIRRKKSPPVDADLQSEQFLELMDTMEQTGYEHYEISNFALPGQRSRHNSSYWSGAKYIGVGPSAHSYNGIERQWNVADNGQYIAGLHAGIFPFEKEILTATQQDNEYIMTALRTMEGIDLSRFSIKKMSELSAKAIPYEERGLIVREENRLRLTRNGKLVADGIAASLFFDEPSAHP